MILPCGTAVTTTGAWPSGQTRTRHLYVLQLWGYKPVDTPLQVLYVITECTRVLYSTCSLLIGVLTMI